MSNQREVAKPDSWKTTQMPTQVADIPFHHHYSASDMQSIRRGLIPEEMEDKWFMFMTDSTLFIHRSWTGHCIYCIRFTADGEDYTASNVMVNRNLEQYKNTDDDYDVRMLAFLIDNLLLDKNTPFPVPSDVSQTIPAELYQHHVAGTGYSETSIETQGQ